MMPVHELLHRIRWDTEFGRGQFQLGYFDRMEKRIVTIAFQEVDFPKEDPHAFVLKDGEGRSVHLETARKGRYQVRSCGSPIRKHRIALSVAPST